ncbi:MAG: hydrogenase maturation protease [Proteobacteria bacterium]|nr:hydrogenase maturation protease [Pseudomonadota bacterium]
MALSTDAEILIAGVGHPLMGDDALGLEVIRKLETESLPEQVRLLYAGASPLDILGELAGIQKLIVIDALTGVAPGEIIKKRCALHHTDIPINETETHGIGLGQTLRLAQELHPGIVIVLIGAGIEPAAAPGTPLHDFLRQMIPALIETIKDEITA